MKSTNNNTGKTVAFIDLTKHYQEFKTELDSAISRVVKSGRFLLGSELQSFEQEFAAYCGVNFAIGVHSGTDALTLGIKALDLKPGDNIIIPANVYPTVFGVALSGAQIKLADINPKTHTISIDSIKQVADANTKAIVGVHLYGNPFDITSLQQFTKDHGIYLIEDCAQATGATYQNKKVGSFGDLGCFSFYPTKNLGAFGDGGMVTTNNPKLAEKIKLLRMYGEKKRYNSFLIGHNSRLDEIQSTILRTKLPYLDNWNKKRRGLAKIYRSALSGLPVTCLEEQVSGQCVYHLFCIQTEKRNGLMEFLAQQGIATAVHYPTPIHLTESFRYLGYKKGDFPVSEKAAQEILSLPLYPEMNEEEIEYVVNNIRSFFNA